MRWLERAHDMDQLMNAAFLADFRETVDTSAARLRAVPEAEAAVRPAPGKWSRKEIIGHLIDSATNNHGRFVRRAAAGRSHLRWGTNRLSGWTCSATRRAEWAELVLLWQSLNHHIAHVMEAADTNALTKPRARHNLDRLAWQAVSAAEPTTLEYFMRDYCRTSEASPAASPSPVKQPRATTWEASGDRVRRDE